MIDQLNIVGASALLAAVLTCLLFYGCNDVKQVDWVRIGGDACQTTKINPAWWTAETSTACIENGKAVQITTNHDDIGILAGIGGLIGLVVGAGL